MGIFSKKGFLTLLNGATNFQTSQRWKSFLLWLGTIEPSMVKIQKVVPDLYPRLGWSFFHEILQEYIVTAVNV